MRIKYVKLSFIDIYLITSNPPETDVGRWQSVSVLTLLYKQFNWCKSVMTALHVHILHNPQNGFEDDDDDDGEDFELEDEGVAGQTLSSLLEEFAGNYQGEEHSTFEILFSSLVSSFLFCSVNTRVCM